MKKKNIILTESFSFPYSYNFPYQYENESILYVFRQSKAYLNLKRALLFFFSFIFLNFGYYFVKVLSKYFIIKNLEAVNLFITAISSLILFLGWWWLKSIWMKNICIISSDKIINITTKFPLSYKITLLPLEAIKSVTVAKKMFFQKKFNFRKSQY